MVELKYVSYRFSDFSYRRLQKGILFIERRGMHFPVWLRHENGLTEISRLYPLPQ